MKKLIKKIFFKFLKIDNKEKILRKHILRKQNFLSKKKKMDRPNTRTNGESKAIHTKSHLETYTYTLTKKGKGEKLIYPPPKVHLLNLG